MLRGDASRPDNRLFSSAGCVWTLPSPLPPQAGSALRALLSLAPSSPAEWSSLVLISRLMVCPGRSPSPGLVPVGRATFIGRCPLALPWWSLGAVCHGRALLVLLLLLFHLLDDLPDFPLCSLWEQRRVCLSSASIWGGVIRFRVLSLTSLRWFIYCICLYMVKE